MPETVESIQRDVSLYSSAVTFFASFRTFLDKRGIRNKVEHTVKRPNNPNAIPDFMIFDESEQNITVILEHKKSLSDDTFERIKDTYDKYSQVVFNEKIHSPEIVFLYPKFSEKRVEAVKEEIDFDIVLCEYDLNFELERINFRQTWNEVTDQKLNPILQPNINIQCRQSDFTKYKFMREEPHIVYTSGIVIPILNVFRDIQYLRKESFFVNYNDLLGQTESFFPDWIEDTKQITKGRINKSLKFLDKIGFLRWKHEGEEIEAFRSKGRRTGDITLYLAQKYVALKSKEEREKAAIEALSEKQTRLDEYFSGDEITR